MEDTVLKKRYDWTKYRQCPWGRGKVKLDFGSLTFDELFWLGSVCANQQHSYENLIRRFQIPRHRLEYLAERVQK